MKKLVIGSILAKQIEKDADERLKKIDVLDIEKLKKNSQANKRYLRTLQNYKENEKVRRNFVVENDTINGKLARERKSILEEFKRD